MSAKYSLIHDQLQELMEEYAPIPQKVLHLFLSGKILSCDIVISVCNQCPRRGVSVCPYDYWQKGLYDQKKIKEFKKRVRLLVEEKRNATR